MRSSENLYTNKIIEIEATVLNKPASNHFSQEMKQLLPLSLKALHGRLRFALFNKNET